MNVVSEVRTIVVMIPAGSVAAYGEIGQALGIGPGWWPGSPLPGSPS